MESSECIVEPSRANLATMMAIEIQETLSASYHDTIQDIHHLPRDDSWFLFMSGEENWLCSVDTAVTGEQNASLDDAAGLL
jgi:hypothetical protein